MSWGIDVKNVYLPRIAKNEIRSKFEENERIINEAEKIILQLMSATPRDTIKDIEGNPMAWEEHVRFELETQMEAICEAAGKNFVLMQVINDPDNVSADD